MVGGKKKLIPVCEALTNRSQTPLTWTKDSGPHWCGHWSACSADCPQVLIWRQI